MSFVSNRGLLVAALFVVPLQSISAQGGARMTGPHANEAFCKTMMTQYDLSTTYMRSSIGRAPDPKTRTKFFADQRALNATLLRQAPMSLKGDIALINKD